MNKKQLALLRKRDSGCWHCGVDETVPHHRLNRGMGGSPSLDRLSNVILICAAYNLALESNSAIASKGREQGHKLRMGANPSKSPVFDANDGEWYLLDDLGNRVNIEEL